MAVVQRGAITDRQRSDAALVKTTRPPRFRLGSDLRFELFGALLGLGLLHHELQFILEQQRTGPFVEYLQRWSAIKPSLGWPNEIGVALHLVNVILAVALLVLPRRRALLAVVAVPYWLSLLASPERMSAHASLVGAALAVILLLGLAELAERGRSGGQVSTDWYRWTIVGLLVVFGLTYVFSAFHKLNPVWFDYKASKGVDFVISLTDVWHLPRSSPLVVALGYLAMVGTVVVEAALPLLVLFQSTRLAAFLLGCLLHLPMLAFGVGDFPTSILAFFPLFLSPDEARTLLQRLRSPSIGRLLTVALIGSMGVTAQLRSAHVDGLYENSPGLEPLVMHVHTVTLALTVILVAYLAATLATMQLGRVHAPVPRLARA